MRVKPDAGEIVEIYIDESSQNHLATWSRAARRSTGRTLSQKEAQALREKIG